MLFSFVALGLLGHAVALAKQLACNEKIPVPEYFGTKVTSMEVKEVLDWDDWNPIADFLQIPFIKRPISFCNITLTHTHPGQGDNVNAYLWLPLKGWNGNFLGMGGGGFAAGGEGNLGPAVARGYAAVMTDSGHTFHGGRFDVTTSARTWALSSPGNVNWQLLHDFASVSLDDMTNLGKAVVKSFYGNASKHSYWNGCSTGGRQGLMNAQRYPTNYDGILANAPANNWVTLLPAEQWPQVLMEREGYWPPPCEVETITRAAIEACDELDGVEDGIVAAPGLCKFDAESIIGNSFDCNGETRTISAAAARIVNGAWEGVKRNGKLEWWGLSHDTMLSTSRTDLPLGGLAQTKCDKGNKNCKSSRMPISESWIQHFLAKDPEYDVDSMKEDDFFRFLHQSRQEYTSVIDTADPDLSEFRAAGGKMITWHGLADQLIFPNGSSNYYERVLGLDPNAADFYRYFEAPGVAHCGNGPGAYPGGAFDALVDWVEKGKVPEHLHASTSRNPSDGKTGKTRPLCLYPQVAAYRGGDPDLASSFECAATFGSKKASNHVEHNDL